MEKPWVLPDTEQTKRMKELALNDAYMNSGEMYKFLSNKIMHELVLKISEGKVQLTSDFVYGRSIITKEEKFLENLDKYISYVKEHYFFNPVEQILIIEMSLENKYNEILYSLEDFHTEESYNKYTDSFRKMFFYNFYENICYYSKMDNGISYIKQMSKELKKYDYDNEEDMKIIEQKFKRVLYIRNNNIYNSFVHYKDSKDVESKFYFHCLDWVLSEYYENHQESIFDIRDNDHCIETSEESKVIFNIKDFSKNMKQDDKITIEFGIRNENFSAKVSNITLSKRELDKLIYELENISDMEDGSEISMSFVDTRLYFNFWSDLGAKQYVELEFHYNGSTEFFNLSLDNSDITNLLDIIKQQIN